MTITASFPVHDASGVATVRRAAVLAAERHAFSAAQAGRVALVATELATNLHKHARGGEILIRLLEQPSEPEGIEILSIDRGPGIRDLAAARRDGHSTAGTLGHGLGAVERQADLFEIYSRPSGTVAVARILKERDAQPSHALTAVRIGAVLVSMPGEQVCGDGLAWHVRRDRVSVLVVDGLGHGLQAHDAARAAVAAFGRVAADPPAAALGAVHEAMRHTRGGAAAVLALDLDRGVARFAGLGNIAGVILPDTGARRGLVSMNGTAGHGAPRIQEFVTPAPKGAVIVMHSDGIATQWHLDAYASLRAYHPSLTAAVLYRDFSRRRDDVAVVVVGERT